jgi:hypothetical protein
MEADYRQINYHGDLYSLIYGHFVKCTVVINFKISFRKVKCCLMSLECSWLTDYSAYPIKERGITAGVIDRQERRLPPSHTMTPSLVISEARTSIFSDLYFIWEFCYWSLFVNLSFHKMQALFKIIAWEGERIASCFAFPNYDFILTTFKIYKYFFIYYFFKPLFIYFFPLNSYIFLITRCPRFSKLIWKIIFNDNKHRFGKHLQRLVSIWHQI